MKNLIYQYWDGNLTKGCQIGSDCMKEYADRIGAKYLFEHNPRFVTNLGAYSPHYGQFKIVYDPAFQEYDNVLFTDTDVFPVENLNENIFEDFDVDIGICLEHFQPKQRQISLGKIITKLDEQWASVVKNNWGVEMPRTADNLLKVYNSGVVMYSNKGMRNAQEQFVPFLEYVNTIKNTNMFPGYYTSDQTYIHAMLFITELEHVVLDNKWNSFVHYAKDKNHNGRWVSDLRTSDTNLVHIQLAGADNFDKEKLWRITNLPQEEWKL